jgi:hypothetical protein
VTQKEWVHAKKDTVDNSSRFNLDLTPSFERVNGRPKLFVPFCRCAALDGSPSF